ncbi:MAG: YggS family pyridoxal phosphate-dependent enzyme [Treponema sp.]|jgi:pyridoxal phosphate enzyme (YggS family)|nr:YggS family pyridoxal phosphate-dependent enzyme [Treponema sp.]
MSVAENLAIIEERIHKVCAVSGRKRDEITLMGVSKLQPLEAVEQAWEAGLRCFGESRVQEATTKLAGLRESHSGAELHLIGSLQRNKAKAAAAFFDCIQSVDREALIRELAQCAAARETPLSLLLELHTAEDSKSGFASLDEVYRAVELALACPFLRIRGLMTIAPNTRDEGPVRASFRQLAKAQKELNQRFALSAGGSCLSMGMSGDLEIAVEEGSTLLRIGTAIFGERK